MLTFRLLHQRRNQFADQLDRREQIDRHYRVPHLQSSPPRQVPCQIIPAPLTKNIEAAKRCLAGIYRHRDLVRLRQIANRYDHFGTKPFPFASNCLEIWFVNIDQKQVRPFSQPTLAAQWHRPIPTAPRPSTSAYFFLGLFSRGQLRRLLGLLQQYLPQADSCTAANIQRISFDHRSVGGFAAMFAP